MSDNEQRFYESLKASEKMRLRREYNGVTGRGPVFIALYLFAMALFLAGAVIVIMFYLSNNRQYWQLSGFIMVSVGIFVTFTMMLMLNTKDKNIIKVLGSKNKIVLYIAAAIVSVLGNIFITVSIFTREQIWFYIGLFALFAGVVLLVLPSLKQSAKDKLSAKEEEEKFFVWLEQEKNIVRKNTDIQN